MLWTCIPQTHLRVFQLCLWPLIAPGYLGEVCHASHQPSDASTPWLTSSLLSSKDYHYYDYHYSTPSLLFTQPIFLEITPVLQVRPGPHPIGLNCQCLFLYTDGCLSRHPRNRVWSDQGKLSSKDMKQWSNTCVVLYYKPGPNYPEMSGARSYQAASWDERLRAEITAVHAESCQSEAVQSPTACHWQGRSPRWSSSVPAAQTTSLAASSRRHRGNGFSPRTPSSSQRSANTSAI